MTPRIIPGVALSLALASPAVSGGYVAPIIAVPPPLPAASASVLAVDPWALAAGGALLLVLLASGGSGDDSRPAPFVPAPFVPPPLVTVPMQPQPPVSAPVPEPETAPVPEPEITPIPLPAGGVLLGTGLAILARRSLWDRVKAAGRWVRREWWRMIEGSADPHDGEIK